MAEEGRTRGEADVLLDLMGGGPKKKQSCPAKLTVASPSLPVPSTISSTAVQLVPSERGRCFGRAGRRSANGC